MHPAGLLRQWVLTKVNGLGKLFALLSFDQGDDPTAASVADGFYIIFRY